MTARVFRIRRDALRAALRIGIDLRILDAEFAAGEMKFGAGG